MQRLGLFSGVGGPQRVLALGAHADDIEIGCGGTLLRLASERPDLEVLWVVLAATDERAREAEASAAAFLRGFARSRVVVKRYRDGFLPWSGASVKEEFEALKREFDPHVVFTHFLHDRHQDHRLVADLTWNTGRNHLVLEYEVPKYDGDFGSPNVFSPLPAATIDRKIALLLEHFPSQAGKHWMTPDLVRAVARIRGMECVASELVAEAFYCRKAVL